MTATAAAPPPARWRVLLLAVLGSVLGVLLPIVPASASASAESAAETGVGARHLTDTFLVARSDDVAAGQRRDHRPVAAVTAVRSRVAPKALPAGQRPVAAIGPAGNPGAFPALRTSTESLQHTFSNHAPDFGVTGNWSKQAGDVLEKTLRGHINAPATTRIPGTYHKTSVIHNVDPSTGLNVIQSPTGGLVSGWRLNPQQLWNVLNRGSL